MDTLVLVEYDKKKKRLIDAFKRGLNASSHSFSLKKSTSNLFRNRQKDNSNQLDVKQFNQVLSIDPVHLIAEVEGMTSYETLVDSTLKFNLLPAVVPQLKTITVGGALVGLGIESTSFRYGLVHETILEIEVLTGEGEVIIVRPDNEHRELFFALPNSYGTLGYALKVKLKLIPAKKYVSLTNLRFNQIETYFQKMGEIVHQKRSLSADTFIDGVIFSENEQYIILGEFTDEAPSLSNYTFMQVYYKSIPTKQRQYLTTYDYIWRWDADWFWCSKHFGMQYPLLRLLFGKWMLHSSAYWKIKRLIATNRFIHWIVHLFFKSSESVIQDILIPVQNAPSFYEFLRKHIQITPIWICPFQFYQKDKGPIFESRATYTLCSQLDPSVLYIDFGFWDMIPSTHFKGFFNRLIERKCSELDGFKSLYSDSFYSEEEFWQIYSKGYYQKLKSQYDPKKAFKDLYQKCVRS